MISPSLQASHIPGQPCSPSCRLCAQSVPMAGQVNPIEGQAKRDLYESGRRVWRELNGIPRGAWRDSSQ